MKFLVLTVSAALVVLTSAQDCSKCFPSSINLKTSNPIEKLTSNPKAEPGKNTQGCATLTITCTSTLGKGGPGALMTFQDNLGGPAPGPTVTATLVCGAEGQWMFSQPQAPSTAITAVYCFG